MMIDATKWRAEIAAAHDILMRIKNVPMPTNFGSKDTPARAAARLERLLDAIDSQRGTA